MHDRQRLDWLAIELAPAVNGQTLWFLEDSRRQHDILFTADYQQAERPLASLFFDDRVVFDKCSDRLALNGHWVRRQANFRGGVDRIDHLSCRQRAFEL